MSSYSFRNKNILITGASGGLGSAMVRLLAKQNARMVLTSRSETALHELIGSLSQNIIAISIIADLSTPKGAEYLAQEALKSLGRIDVLINNAGVGYFSTMEEATSENIRHLFEVNTFAPLALIKALVPEMKAQKSGRIVNIVSCAGRVPIPTVGVYGGSKSALAIMANTMRLELEPAGIDIINIYPGTVATSFEENALREKERPGLCPKDRCGMPRYDIAEQVLSAASGPPGEIWLQRQGKFLSTASLIWPKYVDRRLASLRNQALEDNSLKPRQWRLIQIESSLACNLKCVMCPWQEISKRISNRGLMSPEIWASIRPHLPEIAAVDFTGGGEPLLQPHLIEWIGEAAAAGCNTGFLSNGVLLKEEISKKLIDIGIDWIGISMDGASADIYEKIRIGSNFNRVCTNVANIAKLRTGAAPKIMINFVLMSTNFHEVEEIIRLASDLGVDQVNFKQCDVIRGDHGKGLGLFSSQSTKEIKRFEKSLSKARRKAKKLGIQTTAFSFTPEEKPVCDQDPRNSMFIRYDGSVAPCINLAVGGATTFLGKNVTMPKVDYGKLPQQGLKDVWETKLCQYFKDTFSNRVSAHEKAMVSSFIGTSSRRKVHDEVRRTMPKAFKGCQVCHYLFDI
jgi:short-subunit dehydrogenase/MoaA/NifB/PqqE/SkfB family radical SAM enzyme